MNHNSESKMQEMETVSVSSYGDCSPSSMSLMESSQYCQAFFHDLYDIYPTDCDLRCRYTLTKAVKYMHGDRIGLYKAGWKFVTDFIQFKLAPIPLSEKEHSSLRVTFSANLLPKEENELYQLCYITNDNKVIGASVPFAFRRPDQSDLVDVEDRNDPGLTVYKSRIAVLHDKIARLEDDKETAELKCHMMAERITILEKELSSVTQSNENLTRFLDEAKHDVSVSRGDLAAVTEEMQKLKSVCNNLEAELIDFKSKCLKLSSELVSGTDEKNQVLSELNSVKQEQLHAKLMLDEMSTYSSKLKDEVDGLKERNGLLMADEKVQKGLVSKLKVDCEKLKEENVNLTAVINQSNQHVLSGQGRNQATDLNEQNQMEEAQSLRQQLNVALALLDETLQNQPSGSEQQAVYISQLEEDVKRLSEIKVVFEKRLDELTDAMKHRDAEITNIKSQYSSACEKNSDMTLTLEELRINIINYEREIRSLREKLDEAERNPVRKNKELEELVERMKKLISTEPNFNEFCKIFMESTRITAMNSYKDLFSSLQYIDFEHAEIGAKVRRLLDEFGVLKQDLDRCRQEIHDRIKEQHLSKAELVKVTAENEFHKEKVVEMNETVNELKNCLCAVKKDSDEIEIEKLKSEIVEMRTKSENLERQLKEVKVANALTNIGQTSVGHASLSAEINSLRSKLSELESQQSLPKDCCGGMQERLKQSAKEYARLYNQLMTERTHYKAICSSVSGLKQSANLVPVSSEVFVTPTASCSNEEISKISESS